MTDRRRVLPSVDAVLRAGPVRTAERRRLTEAIRAVLREARATDGADGRAAAYLRLARARLAEADRPTLRPVLNATGVVLHTNLGRAPLAPAALRAIGEAAGAVSVEYDLVRGTRGERHGHPAALLAELTGAEGGIVVNNGAAAVLLTLAALAARKEVIVARGELVEIGGGFRIPEVLARSGAKLVEVGTTNRTYVRDYAASITPRTAALLRVHASNFKVSGFVAHASSDELAALARERGIAFAHDLGSGTLLDTARYGLGREETVQEAVAAGADVVTFSGDKLLGGPQAGIIVGRAASIARLRAHPLMRAIRPDKLTLAALVATLRAYRDGTAERELPIWRMISASERVLARRARSIASALEGAGIPAAVVVTRSTVGGGSLPEEGQPSRGVVVGRDSPNELLRRLRAADPPVIGRIADGQALLDVRTVLPEDDEQLIRAVCAALG